MNFSRSSPFDRRCSSSRATCSSIVRTCRGHQAEQIEPLALLVRKGRALVVHRVAQELRAVVGRFHRGPMGDQGLHRGFHARRDLPGIAIALLSLSTQRSVDNPPGRTGPRAQPSLAIAVRRRSRPWRWPRRSERPVGPNAAKYLRKRSRINCFPLLPRSVARFCTTHPRNSGENLGRRVVRTVPSGNRERSASRQPRLLGPFTEAAKTPKAKPPARCLRNIRHPCH